MHKVLVALALMLSMSGCTVMKVVETNPETGYFPSSKKAVVVTNAPVDLDAKKALLLVPNGDFTGEMVRNIGYFDEVINFEELEKRIIKNNLTAKVPSIEDRIGVNNAAKHYKPFLWLYWDTRKEGMTEYLQLVLTDPITLEDYLVAETVLDRVWAGVNDQNNWYPAMNALIDYIDEHSESFEKK